MSTSASLVDDNQVRNPLRQINQQDLRFRGKPIKLRANPFFRYNYFATCYNANYNMIDNTPLVKIKRNRIYYAFFPILLKRYIVINLFVNFIPYLNLA